MPHRKIKGLAFRRGFVRYVGTHNHRQWFSCLSYFRDPCAMLINQPSLLGRHLCDDEPCFDFRRDSHRARTNHRPP
jgi:hypothetical protein